MVEIFLYTTEAALSASDRDALVKVGIIPIKVARLDAVERLPAPLPIPQGEMDAISLLALDGLTQAGHEVRRNFVERLVGSLKAAKQRARAASGTLASGGDAKQAPGASPSGPVPKGDAQ